MTQALYLMDGMQLVWYSSNRFWTGSPKMLQNNLNKSKKYVTMTKKQEDKTIKEI